MYQTEEYKPEVLTIITLSVVYALMMVLVVGVTGVFAYEICLGEMRFGGWIGFGWLTISPLFTFGIGLSAYHELS